MSSDSCEPPATVSRPGFAERQRERLLTATVEVAGERGWAAMTLAEVVTRAGVSKRTVYDHFDDKLDCFLAAARHVIDSVSALTLRAYHQAGGGREGLAAGIDALLRFCGASPPTARVYLVETTAAGPAGVALWREHMEAMSKRAICALGQLREDLPPHAGSMAIGNIYTVAQARVLAGQARQLPELAPSMTAALCTTMGVD
jgi:AcrR family transcriptional regulator